jgi:hydroxyethylthiazole kinase
MAKRSYASALWQDVERIRQRAPLVHNITNYVAMNSTANALLALGGAPVMAHAAEEVEDIVRIASALVVNVGTLSAPWIQSMRLAMVTARQRGIPVVLDPVGAGASALRTETCLELIGLAPPTVLRGNPSEVRALCLAGATTRGVDSRDEAETALEPARRLSRTTGAVVSISGPVDLIVLGEEVIEVANGHPLMTRVTGLGCAASALTGAFIAVNPDPQRAAAHAMATMGICGELAAATATGPGSFEVAFLDALYGLDEETVRQRLRLRRRPG